MRHFLNTFLQTSHMLHIQSLKIITVKLGLFSLNHQKLENPFNLNAFLGSFKPVIFILSSSHFGPVLVQIMSSFVHFLLRFREDKTEV